MEEHRDALGYDNTQAPGSSQSVRYQVLFSALLINSPEQQCIDPVDLVIGDTTEDIGEPGLWIDAVEFGYPNERAGNGGGISPLSQPLDK